MADTANGAAASARTAPRRVLVTGATGLIGARLLASWSRDPAFELHALVRGAAGVPPERRLAEALARAGAPRNALRRIRIHVGDLRAPDLHLPAPDVAWLRAHLTDIVHAAADIALDDRAGGRRLRRINVGGVRAVCRLLGPATRLFHVSTAYVAGLPPRGDAGAPASETWTGARPVRFRNPYERTKWEAEAWLRARFADAPPARLTVWRPSIVVGDSRTARTSQRAGLYAMLAALRALERRAPGATVRLRYDPASTQNYVPVDWVVEWMDAVFRDPAAWGRTYHLASETPIANAAMAECLATLLDLRLIPARDARAPAADPLARILARRAGPYLAYLRRHPRFDCANRRRLPGGARDFTPDAAFLSRALVVATAEDA